MKNRQTTGFWLDFRRVFSRRVSGNAVFVLTELVFQPIIVAALVFIAFLNREEVNPYRLNFLYFSTLYAFWVGLFGACQSINSEVRSGEWCYWVLGMGRNRTTHVLAIGGSSLSFAMVQCLVFLCCIVAFSGMASLGFSHFNHFTDMFVRIIDGEASVDPIYQMNGALSYVLSASWGRLGPNLFATGIFALSLFAALLSGMSLGLLFGAIFKEPATSLNMAVGLVVLIGMVSFCGLRGDGDNDEKVGCLFAPLRDRKIINTSQAAISGKAVPVVHVSYFFPQRYFFNIGSVTFEKEWSDWEDVQAGLRGRIVVQANDSVGISNPEAEKEDKARRFHARWLEKKELVSFPTVTGANAIADWIDLDDEERETLTNQDPNLLIQLLKEHSEYLLGWKVALYWSNLRLTIVGEMLVLLLLDFLFVTGTVLAIWILPWYHKLR